MSLYVGNLSARTRGDELKHVFWKFGRCGVRLKEGYGFVEYEFVQDAEKALRTLQGRNICGEPLTLTWSNKQLKPFPRFPRGVRSYELQRETNFSRGGDYVSGKRNACDWRDNELDYKQRESDGRGLNSVNMGDKDRGDQQGDIKDYDGEHRDFREGLPFDNGSDVPNLVDSGRWGDQVHDSPDDNEADGGEFDRHEPYQGHDRKDEDENHQRAYSGGGSAPRSSQENMGRESMSYTTLDHSNDLKMQNACFSYGVSGHKIRNCPRKYSSVRKFTRFHHRQDDSINTRSRGEAELERYGSSSLEKLQLRKDTASRHMNDMTASGSGENQRLIRNGSSHIRQESDKTEIKDHEGKKRSRREGESPERHSGKKAKRSVSSSVDCDQRTSRSRSRSTSQTSKSVPKNSSWSRSRSISRVSHSLSSKSRSSSNSKVSNSRSRSSSSLSGFISLSQSPHSSNKEISNLKASVYKSNTPISKEILVEQRQPIEGDACIENADDGNAMAVVKSKDALSGFELEDDMKSDHPLRRSDDDENHSKFRLLYEVTNPSTPLPEIGGHTAGSSSPEGLRDTSDLQKSGEPVMGQMPPQSKEPGSETRDNYCTGSLTCMSSDEMCMVLKHYGLELPEESGGNLPVEGYFCSARLWPWEIIYYRRLKKGLISVENYAKRVAQNQEFGIVDKYIRSSSGWGETNQNNR